MITTLALRLQWLSHFNIKVAVAVPTENEGGILGMTKMDKPGQTRTNQDKPGQTNTNQDKPPKNWSHLPKINLRVHNGTPGTLLVPFYI